MASFAQQLYLPVRKAPSIAFEPPWLSHARRARIPVVVAVRSLTTNRHHFGPYAARSIRTYGDLIRSRSLRLAPEDDLRISVLVRESL